MRFFPRKILPKGLFSSVTCKKLKLITYSVMQDSMMMTQHTMYTLNIAVMRWKYRLYVLLGTLSGATAAAFLEVLIEKYTDYSGIIDILIG